MTTKATPLEVARKLPEIQYENRREKRWQARKIEDSGVVTAKTERKKVGKKKEGSRK